MIPETFAETKRYFLCPHCGKGKMFYSHLKVLDTFGPWHCDDCGCAVTGRITETGLEIEKHPERIVKTTEILRLEPAEPVVLLVEGMRFVDGKYASKTEDDEVGSKTFFYEENRSHLNTLHEVKGFITRGEVGEPFDLVKYVGYVDEPATEEQILEKYRRNT